MKLTQKLFLELKVKGIEQAKAKNPCEGQLQRAIDAQTWDDMKEVIINNILWCNDYDILVPDGKYINKKRKFTVINGKLHGEYISYYHDGQVEFKGTFVNGKKHDEFERYYSDGQVHFKCNYLNGKLHGEYVSHWDNGQVAVKFTYVDGQRID